MDQLFPFRRWAARCLERRYRLDTSGQVGFGELGYDPRERFRYEPSRWLILRSALSPREVTREDVFVDLGSGKGRVVFQAALHYPFKRVVGVELSEELNAIARANLERNRHRLRCSRVELVTADASEWTIPDDVTVAYLYNPFFGEAFSRTVERLVDACDRRGGPLRVIYVNPVEHERMMATGRAVELPPPSGLFARIAGVPRGAVRRYELRPRAPLNAQR